MKRFVVAAVVVALVLMAGMAQAANKADPTGTWKWTVKFNDREREMTLKLKLEDGKLTGAMVRGDRETPIQDGQFKDGEVSFKVVRERQGNKMTKSSLPGSPSLSSLPLCV